MSAHKTNAQRKIKRSSHLDLSFAGRGNAESFPLFFRCFVSLKELKLVANFSCFHLNVLNKITRSYNICRRLAQKNRLEMSYKDDNSFEKRSQDCKMLYCVTQCIRLHQGFLLSKYHVVAWNVHESTFVLFANKKSKAPPPFTNYHGINKC